jgi:hypothetical protein
MFVIVPVSALPIGLEKLNAPPVESDDAVNEPLPAIFIVIPDAATTSVKVTSLYWEPVKENVL